MVLEMTAHTHSDDLAINAAQDRIRDNYEASVRAWAERACKEPNGINVNGLTRAALSLQGFVWAEMRRRTDCQGEWAPDAGRYHGAQNDFGRNPAPIREAPNGERMPLPRNTP